MGDAASGGRYTIAAYGMLDMKPSIYNQVHYNSGPQVPPLSTDDVTAPVVCVCIAFGEVVGWAELGVGGRGSPQGLDKLLPVISRCCMHIAQACDRQR